jgi:hypothetical protein
VVHGEGREIDRVRDGRVGSVILESAACHELGRTLGRVLEDLDVIVRVRFRGRDDQMASRFSDNVEVGGERGAGELGLVRAAVGFRENFGVKDAGRAGIEDGIHREDGFEQGIVVRAGGVQERAQQE